MRKRTGPTLKERRAAAEKLLLALLRTPKTRAGLVAAACTHQGITKSFVFGWLTAAGRTGVVTMLKSVNPVQYQATDDVVVERPAESTFPTWLEPRTLPTSTGRHVYIDGRPLRSSGVQQT